MKLGGITLGILGALCLAFAWSLNIDALTQKEFYSFIPQDVQELIRTRDSLAHIYKGLVVALIGMSLTISGGIIFLAGVLLQGAPKEASLEKDMGNIPPSGELY